MYVKEIKAYNSKQQCRSCGSYRHFGSDNNDDELLKSGVESRLQPMSQSCKTLYEGPSSNRKDSDTSASCSNVSNRDNVMSFKMANLHTVVAQSVAKSCNGGWLGHLLMIVV